MNRRELLLSIPALSALTIPPCVAGGLLLTRLDAAAQQAGKVYRIGFL
jgi:hypothetical protein